MCFETASCLLWGVNMWKIDIAIFLTLDLAFKKERKKRINCKICVC